MRPCGLVAFPIAARKTNRCPVRALMAFAAVTAERSAGSGPRAVSACGPLRTGAPDRRSATPHSRKGPRSPGNPSSRSAGRGAQRRRCSRFCSSSEAHSRCLCCTSPCRRRARPSAVVVVALVAARWARARRGRAARGPHRSRRRRRRATRRVTATLASAPRSHSPSSAPAARAHRASPCASRPWPGARRGAPPLE